mgnify:CR=1 FL=1|tara:strand:+ start:1676 stop:2590 length:915 start_codon:yes stop_codon:yes gene_type:complete
MKNYTNINGVDYIGLDFSALANAYRSGSKNRVSRNFNHNRLGTNFNCDMDGCGASFIRGGVVVVNSGLLIGWDCMDKIDGGLLRAHVSNIPQSESSNNQREQLSNNSEAVNYYVDLYHKGDIIKEDAIEIFKGYKRSLYDLKKVAGTGGFNKFLNELIAQFFNSGRLSPSQIAVFEKSYARLQEFRAESIKRDSEEFRAIPNARIFIRGSIQSIKPVSTKFGEVKRAIVITDDEPSYKFSCNLPSAVENEAVVNNNIQMSITLKPSDNNKYFGYGSRPSKAKIWSDDCGYMGSDYPDGGMGYDR